MWKNTLQAKWVILSLIGATALVQYGYYKPMLLKHEVYGMDGNGGLMLKIITNLTDEEIARLKF